MRFTLFGIDFFISYIFVCAFLIFMANDTSGQFIPLIFSVFVHEAGHIIMLFIFGQKLKRADLKIGAIRVEYSSYAIKSERIVALLAGPLSNLLLALIWHLFGNENLFYINIVLCVYNLLPIKGLDGGSIIEALSEGKISPKKIDLFLNLTTFAVAIFVLVGFFLLYKNSMSNYSLILFCIYLILPFIIKKFS